LTRNLTLTAAAVAVAGLSGCTAAQTGSSTAAPVSTPVAARAKADALLVAVQGYSESFLAGDVSTVTSYLHPDCASPRDQRSVTTEASVAPRPARGTTLTVDTVEMSADSGRIGNWHLSGGAPDKLKTRVKTTAAEQAKGMPWRYVAGEWQFRPATCGGTP
jgi:hypothetical protein